MLHLYYLVSSLINIIPGIIHQYIQLTSVRYAVFKTCIGCSMYLLIICPTLNVRSLPGQSFIIYVIKFIVSLHRYHTV